MSHFLVGKKCFPRLHTPYVAKTDIFRGAREKRFGHYAWRRKVEWRGSHRIDDFWVIVFITNRTNVSI